MQGQGQDVLVYHYFLYKHLSYFVVLILLDIMSWFVYRKLSTTLFLLSEFVYKLIHLQNTGICLRLICTFSWYQQKPY